MADAFLLLTFTREDGAIIDRAARVEIQQQITQWRNSRQPLSGLAGEAFWRELQIYGEEENEEASWVIFEYWGEEAEYYYIDARGELHSLGEVEMEHEGEMIVALESPPKDAAIIDPDRILEELARRDADTAADAISELLAALPSYNTEIHLLHV